MSVNIDNTSQKFYNIRILFDPEACVGYAPSIHRPSAYRSDDTETEEIMRKLGWGVGLLVLLLCGQAVFSWIHSYSQLVTFDLGSISLIGWCIYGAGFLVCIGYVLLTLLCIYKLVWPSRKRPTQGARS